MREMGGTVPRNGSRRGTCDSGEYHYCDAQKLGVVECGGSIYRVVSSG